MLTTEQEILLESYYEQWLKLGYSTEALNKGKLKKSLTPIYKSYDLPAPKLYLTNGPQAMIAKAIELGDERGKPEIQADFLYGPWELYWMWQYKFALEIDPNIYDESDKAQLLYWLELAQRSHIVLCYENAVIACNRPTALNVDSEGRLHCENGPALAYGDGTKLFSWHDVSTPEFVILHPETITVSHIETEPNAEVRRVMIERFGEARFIQESGAIEIARDEVGVLYRKELEGDEPMLMVAVINSTPEPDGSLKTYFIRVKPDVTTPREAVAWTFGLAAEEYAPVVET